MQILIVIIIYWFIVKYFSLIFNIFFRDIEVVGRENIPLNGPVIFAVNHPNMAIDALLIGSSCGRYDGHYWVKAGAFKGFVGKFMRFMGGIPVNRKQDTANETEHIDNTKLFDESVRCLNDGESFFIFPEGTSYTGPHIQPLKTGIARLAIAYTQATKLKCPIVCVGINYTRKDKFRSQVLIQYDSPIYVSDQMVTNTKTGPEEFTKEIEEHLKNVTINAPDFETLKLVNTCRNIYTTDMKDSLTLEQYIQYARSFNSIYQKFENHEQMKLLRQDLEEYQKQLDNFNLRDDYFAGKLKKRQTTFILALRILRAIAFMLLALPGFILHLPLYLLARLANKMTPYEESKAMYKYVLLFFTVPLFYSFVVILIGVFYGFSYMVFFSLVFPVIGIFHIYCMEQGLASGRSIPSLSRMLILSALSNQHTDYIYQLRNKISTKLRELSVLYREQLEQEKVPVIASDSPKLPKKAKVSNFLRDSKDQLFI